MTVSEARRAYVLEQHVEDARRAAAGEDPLCDRCSLAIVRPRTNMYRCAECGLPFHERCIRQHFADHTSAPAGREPVFVPGDLHTCPGCGTVVHVDTPPEQAEGEARYTLAEIGSLLEDEADRITIVGGSPKWLREAADWFWYEAQKSLPEPAAARPDPSAPLLEALDEAEGALHAFARFGPRRVVEVSIGVTGTRELPPLPTDFDFKRAASALAKIRAVGAREAIERHEGGEHG